jgi:hypothetical protein
MKVWRGVDGMDKLRDDEHETQRLKASNECVKSSSSGI